MKTKMFTLVAVALTVACSVCAMPWDREPEHKTVAVKSELSKNLTNNGGRKTLTLSDNGGRKTLSLTDNGGRKTLTLR